MYYNSCVCSESSIIYTLFFFSMKALAKVDETSFPCIRKLSERMKQCRAYISATEEIVRKTSEIEIYNNENEQTR